jgi:hypothetical protein
MSVFDCVIQPPSKESGMSPIELIVTVCAVMSPNNCEETHLTFTSSISRQQCTMGAMPYIAKWVGDHPKWKAVKWRCEFPHSRADAERRQVG